MNDRISLREAYGIALRELGQVNERVVALDADISKSTYSWLFGEAFPERFFNLGIAEQNMVLTAAGLASVGYIPFVNSYAVFISMRACEQVRTFTAYPRLNVKLAGGHGGISVGTDGPTHQAIEDISIMRSIPNMTVLAPCDRWDVRACVLAAAEWDGPVYLRLARVKLDSIYTEDKAMTIGKWDVLVEGYDVSIIAYGTMVHEALKAAEHLRKDGISAGVISASTVKPLDMNTLQEAASTTGAIVTCEDQSIIGGLGSAVSETLIETTPIPVERIGLRDVFATSGSADELYERYGLSFKHIAEACKRVVRRKIQTN